MAAELQRFRKEYVQPVQLRYHSCPVSPTHPVPECLILEGNCVVLLLFIKVAN